MTRRSQLLVAGLIAIIGAAVYLAIAVGGSRPASTPAETASERPVTPPPRPAIAARDMPTLTPAAPPTPAPPVEAPKGAVVHDPGVGATVDEQHAVAEWIDARKSEWVSACWPQPGPDRAPPEPTTVQLRAVFEASGKLRTHAFVASGLPDVSRCLNERPFDPPFASRGKRVDLALTFLFP